MSYELQVTSYKKVDKLDRFSSGMYTLILHFTPYTLHLTLYTLHLTPYTIQQPIINHKNSTTNQFSLVLD